MSESAASNRPQQNIPPNIFALKIPASFTREQLAITASHISLSRDIGNSTTYQPISVRPTLKPDLLPSKLSGRFPKRQGPTAFLYLRLALFEHLALAELQTSDTTNSVAIQSATTDPKHSIEKSRTPSIDQTATHQSLCGRYSRQDAPAHLCIGSKKYRLATAQPLTTNAQSKNVNKD
jgi:hypothetical protein